MPNKKIRVIKAVFNAEDRGVPIAIGSAKGRRVKQIFYTEQNLKRYKAEKNTKSIKFVSSGKF